MEGKMKKSFLFTSILVFALMIVGSSGWAGEETEDTFTLEEITVTAEKREQLIQKIPSSVAVIEGDALVAQGRITTAQILESIPNVKFEEGTDANPNGGIAIRGLQYKMTSMGQPPSATATYVDGVFQGIGGNFDINRVEILRGPQGTLYGRSATGGVVAFHTNNPKLSDFSGSASLEVGEANLKNVQAAVNVPVGDVFALRGSGHFYEKDGYHNPDGGWTKTMEGRIKALYQPTDALEILFGATLSDRKTASGGYQARLTSPDTIDYEDTVTDVVESGTKRSTMGDLTINYDFGQSVLTYIGALRKYVDDESPPSTVVRPNVQIMHNLSPNYGENFQTHELRWASDSDGMLSWLIGANYYYSDYDREDISIQHTAYIDGSIDPDPNAVDAPIGSKVASGDITNIGLFTEETLELSEDFRVTAGLRYDQTDLDIYRTFDVNANINLDGNSLNPPDWLYFYANKTIDFDNVTYKLRLEYDLTPQNMLYALTSTGFQPGDLRTTNKRVRDEAGNLVDVLFVEMPYEEEKLTAYEIGSKNRFLDNRLQVNAAVFYYDYEGYTHTANISTGGPPTFAQIVTPLEMKGLELDADWMLTPNDLLALSVAYLDAKITSFPVIDEVGDTSAYMALTRLPGLPEFTATLKYNHTFSIANGSTLVPRMELRYTDGMYVDQLTVSQVESGLGPYSYQDGYVIADIGATWNSPASKYAVTGYVRNLFDEEYKAEVSTGGATVDACGVTAGDPRAWGLMASVRF